MITRRFLMLAGAAGFALPALVSPAEAKKGDTPLPPPLSQLAALSLTHADGMPTTLGAETGAGRAVVASLWATWCGPCVDEAKHLSELRASYPQEKLAILGINVDKARDESKIAAFMKRGKVNYTQLRGDAEAVYVAFGGSPPITLPRLYIFAPDGRPTAVFGQYNGGKTLKDIDKAVAAAMAEMKA
jgi:thiol-disulfide isomerase/thioredoxin